MPLIMRFKVEDRSMEPVLYSGDYVIARKYFFSKPRIGDIVIFKHPKKEIKLIKRITRIEKNEYFVEGDNKENSVDSRSFGRINMESVIGKVIFLKSKDRL